jgi:uncharacterized protein YaaW (UPF0174 family)
MRKKHVKSTYDSDFYMWTKVQAELLKKQEFEKMDIKHMIEEIESLGRSQADKMESHLAILLMHLLKAKYQSHLHTRSWDLSVKNAKYHAKRTLEQNPSLKSKLDEILKDAYFTARLSAAQETNLEEKTFPKECPWDIRELMK